MKILSVVCLASCTFVCQEAIGRVVISSPANGGTMVSPVAVAAYSTRNTSGMTIYLNGTPISSAPSTSVNASLTLSPGTYRVRVTAQGNSRYGSSAISTFTVGKPSSTNPGTPTTPAEPTSPSAPTAPSEPTSPPSGTAVANQIGSDMQGQNEGFPHGVPLNYDWATKPVIMMGNNSSGWQAITSWGALYEASEGNPATNSRVNIRNMRTYFLQNSSGKWLLLQNTSRPSGDAYVENFAGDVNKPADLRNEADGSISATAGGGFNFHFYPVNRASIDPNDIGGIVTVVEARLITGDPSKGDDRSSARYLLSSGADYYPALTGGWPGGADYNPGVATGKMKYVRTEWRSFAMSTLSQSELQSNPPPVDLTGTLP